MSRVFVGMPRLRSVSPSKTWTNVQLSDLPTPLMPVFTSGCRRHKGCTARLLMSLGAAASTTNVILRQGVVAAQNREFERARPLLQQVTTETPDDVIAWYWLAIASPSADSAIPCLRRVLAIDR